MIRQSLIDARGKKTQTEVSKSLKISQKYLSRLELGQRTPSTKLLARMVKYYKKPVNVLFPDIFLNENTPNRSKSG
jgi:transcriptional regulator with XRE-family HTH domain